MAVTTTTLGRTFYDEQLDYLYRGDVDGLIDHHYAEDAELVAFDFVIKGRAALKAHFREYLKRLGGLRVDSTDKFQETGDTIFFEATVTTGAFGQVKVFDAFVLRDGKVTHHFTGVK